MAQPFSQNQDFSDLYQLKTHMQSTSQKLELPELKKMVHWKAMHLGINELEIIVKRYLEQRMETMSRQELWDFYVDVVERESDHLFAVLFGTIHI